MARDFTRKDRTLKPVQFEHRHFVFIAAAIRNLPHHHQVTKNNLANIVADLLTPTNPRFNRERFINACKSED